MSDQLSIPGGLVDKQAEALQVFSSHKYRALNHLWDSLCCLSSPTCSIFMNQSSPRIPCCNLTYHVFLHQLFQELSGSLDFRVSLPTSRKSIFFPSSYTNMPPAACHWAWVRRVLPWSLCLQGCILQIVKLRDNFFFPLKFCKKDFWKSDNKISEQRL